jgi:hypothetical protein
MSETFIADLETKYQKEVGELEQLQQKRANASNTISKLIGSCQVVIKKFAVSDAQMHLESERSDFPFDYYEPYSSTII